MTIDIRNMPLVVENQALTSNPHESVLEERKSEPDPMRRVQGTAIRIDLGDDPETVVMVPPEPLVPAVKQPVFAQDEEEKDEDDKEAAESDNPPEGVSE